MWDIVSCVLFVLVMITWGAVPVGGTVTGIVHAASRARHHHK